MTRTIILAAAAVALLAPGMALAQAVPPSRRAPPPDERIPVVAEKTGAVAGLTGSGATVVDTLADHAGKAAASASEAREVDLMTGGFNVMDHPLAPGPHGGAIRNAEKIGGVAKGVGAGAAVVNMTTSAYTFADKCGAEKVNASDCTQASLSATSGVAGAVEVATASAGAARVAGAAQLGADLVAAHKNCTNDADEDKADCALSGLDATMSALGLAVPGGQALPAAYSVGKAIGTGITWGYEQLSGQSLGADLYDWFKGDKDKEAIAAATSAAVLEAARARRRAAYKQTSGELMSRQAAYEQQQARLEAERQAAERQAQMQANQAAANQAFYGNLMGALQPLTQGGVSQTTPCGFWQACAGAITTQAQYDALVAKLNARPASTAIPRIVSCSDNPNLPNCSQPNQGRTSPPPPSSSGDCGGTGPGTCR